MTFGHRKRPALPLCFCDFAGKSRVPRTAPGTMHLLETPMWKQAVRAWGLAALPGMVMAAPPLATATIVDGDAALVRDAGAFGLAEGVRLQKDDIVQTSPRARFVRLEFTNGLIVDLAPETRLMVAPKAGKATPQLYLLAGSVKLAVPANFPADDTVLQAPALQLSAVAKGVVLSTAPQQVALFTESGAATVVERQDFKPQGTVSLRAGQFYVRAGDAKAQVTGRPTGAFIQALPKAFLDTLPSRIELFKARDVPPRPTGEPAYADVQPWIDAEPALRPQFVTRWRSLAKRPDFRNALVADMAAHPEWDRTLFPEKYRPKPPASAAR